MLRGACALALLALAGADAQDARPWLGGSVGIGRLSIHGIAGGGISAEAVGGITLPRNLHVGARLIHVSAVEVASDEAPWTGNTLLATLAWTPDSAITLSTGFGSAKTDQADTDIDGVGSVVETGVELAVPRGHGPALRILLMRTWPVSDPNWSDGTKRGRISQLHLGVGFLFR